MTEALASKTCTPCRGGIPPLTREQAELFLAQAPDWQLVEEAHRIERSFRFSQFPRAAYLPSKYPRINSRLRSLEAYTQTITAPASRRFAPTEARRAGVNRSLN
jgi:hypothetical protein